MWNLLKLRKVCPNILPVVHDPYSGEIDQLYDDGYHYILIGSSDGRIELNRILFSIAMFTVIVFPA